MKTLASIIAFLIAIPCFSQSNEYEIHSNGLIYSESTVNELKKIVDSLNYKFETCEFNKTYFSNYQSKGHYVILDTGDIKSARNAIENEISYDDFLKRFPDTRVIEEMLILKKEYTNRDNEEMISFTAFPIIGYSPYRLDVRSNLKKELVSIKDNWVYSYWEGSKYSDESIRAIFFLEDFSKNIIPTKYAEKIQYSDCMIDTNTQIYKKDAQQSKGIIKDGDDESKVFEFLNYISDETNMPIYEGDDYSSEEYKEYLNNFKDWDSTKFTIIEEKLINTNKFTELLNEAVEEASIEKISNDEFEDYVGRYYSKETELELKRSRRVVGMCSMDNRPRLHAKEIAMLSAETAKWEVFLRSHLDIMNDNFSRASDGSYAWERRQTYIRELEELDINVLDLMFGITLRMENPSQNHYYGSIRRVGRALAESESLDKVEKSILSTIEDESLDDFNRLIFYYLFSNYNNNLKDEDRKNRNLEKLSKSIESLPDYLKVHLN